MPDEKSCHLCQHSRREQTGPHAFFAFCALQQVDFPDSPEHCGSYQPGPKPNDDEDEFWPLRRGWEVTT